MTLLAVGGLGEDIQCTHVQYCILHAHAYYSLYNCDYHITGKFGGLAVYITTAK